MPGTAQPLAGGRGTDRGLGVSLEGQEPVEQCVLPQPAGYSACRVLGWRPSERGGRRQAVGDPVCVISTTSTSLPPPPGSGVCGWGFRNPPSGVPRSSVFGWWWSDERLCGSGRRQDSPLPWRGRCLRGCGSAEVSPSGVEARSGARAGLEGEAGLRSPSLGPRRPDPPPVAFPCRSGSSELCVPRLVSKSLYVVTRSLVFLQPRADGSGR